MVVSANTKHRYDLLDHNSGLSQCPTLSDRDCMTYVDAPVGYGTVTGQ